MSLNNTNNYKPAGYQSLIPTISVSNALEAISFYEKALGAERIDVTMDTHGKKVMHSSVKFGDTIVFIHDQFDSTAAPNSSGFFLYVPDADISFKRAIDAGCTISMPIDDQFWGDRMGMVTDPYGSKWGIATRVKDLSKEEIQKAQVEFMASYQAKKDAGNQKV